MVADRSVASTPDPTGRLASPEPLPYLPYFELSGVPNVIADGHPRRSTVLTLSHWPDSTTPPELQRDLSAQIALAYLGSPNHQVEAQAVSNNHFDIDGFMAVWALSHPQEALADTALVEEVARAGDFGWTDDARAARVAFALGDLRTASTSTLNREVFEGSDPQKVANLYQVLLEWFEELAAGIDEHEHLWAAQVANLAETDQAILEGRIVIEEYPEADLAVVQVDPEVPVASYHYSLQHSGPCHPMPIYRRTSCSRVLYFRGDWVGLTYRFESWVRFVSRTVPPRIDLSGLALSLTDQETKGARWAFGWPNNPNPPVVWLSPESLAPTSLPREYIEEQILTALTSEKATGLGGGPGTYS